MQAKSRLVRATIALLAGALTISGCAVIPPDAEVATVDYKACLASSVASIEAGSIDDQALDGLQRAVLKQGVAFKHSVATASPNTESYVKQLKRLVGAGCNIVVAVSQPMAAATYRVAKANPEVRFVLVDAQLTTSFGQPSELENVRELRFDTATSAFMAGYLAAASSTSGVVAAFTASPAAPVTDVILAFKQGVEHFNAQKGASVSVIGAAGEEPGKWSRVDVWADSAAQTSLAYRLASRGADVIFVYAGSVVLGENPGQGSTDGSGADAASPMFIGSDADWFTLEANAPVAGSILASVTKRVAAEVETTIAMGLTDTFSGGSAGSFVGTLADGSVALTEAHSIAYPAGLAADLSRIASEIAEGTIVVASSINNK